MQKNLFAGALASATVTALLLVGAPSASASGGNSYQISWTKIGIYPRSTPSMDAQYRSGAAIPDGKRITVVCETTGETVTSDAGTSNIWEKTADGVYFPNVFVATGHDGWTPGVPRCDAPLPPQPDNPAPTASRDKAVAWATENYKKPQLGFMSECTIFASRALWAAGLKQTRTWTNATKDADLQGGFSAWNWATQSAVPSKAATVAQTFVEEMVASGQADRVPIAWTDNTASGAQLGDVIAYDWEGDGHIDHVALVTSLNADGYPSVTQKTPDQLNRYWSWSDTDGGWISSPKVFPHAKAELIRVHY